MCAQCVRDNDKEMKFLLFLLTYVAMSMNIKLGLNRVMACLIVNNKPKKYIYKLTTTGYYVSTYDNAMAGKIIIIN